MAPSTRNAKISKRPPTDVPQSNSTSNKRRRVGSAEQKVEEVDLRDVNSDSDLARVLERQRAATVKAQQDEADKPTKLAGVTCVICMEEMTNITVTHCGENQDGKGQSKCPMCRKIVRRPKDKGVGQNVIPLEIKVATSGRA
ncbi:uncharacterized protein KY384_004884 [Bacidia gigantensis]|uniref:uncharacterized protein n=1 Tax=Bacidia gigantensis TaxID=2732470 RepID=UPI001D04A2E9|nr:uncharacterized protein KY384_004884 [Bacidia gigantensis]KAG8530382.1 hypothetical protein KY384_004884 [Bacidia gigantensis]